MIFQNLLFLVFELFLLSGIVVWLHQFNSQKSQAYLLIFLGGLASLVQISIPLGVFVLPTPEINLTLVSNILVPVILLGVLLIYATQGTAPARLAIGGILAVMLTLPLVFYGLVYQLNLSGGSSLAGVAADTQILIFAARTLVASLIGFIVAAYLITILYQAILNRFGYKNHLRLGGAPPENILPIWLATFIAFLGAFWTDVVVFIIFAYAGTPALAEALPGQLISKSITGILIWPIASVYLVYRATNSTDFSIINQRRTFDILLRSNVQFGDTLTHSEKPVGRREVDFATIHAISQEISTSSSLPKLLELIVDRATRLLAAPFGGLYLCDVEKNEVRCVVSHCAPLDFTGVIHSFGEGLPGTVAKTGEPLIINDFETWPGRANVNREVNLFSAMICVPMTWQNQVTGVLHVSDNVVRQFDDDDLALLTELAEQAAAAIENARLLVDTNEKLFREKRLTEIACTISSALDLPTVLTEVVRLAVELIGADAGALALLDSDGHSVRFPYLHNLPFSLRERPLLEEVGLSRDVIQTGVSILLTNYPSLPEAIPDWVSAGVVSVVGVPIVSGDDYIGALGLFGLTANVQFRERDVALVEAVGRQAGAAMQNARIFAESQRQTQELTGLFDAILDTSSELEVDILLERIYKHVGDLFAPDSFAVVLYDSDTEEVRVALAMEEGQKLYDWMDKQYLISEGGLSSWVIQNRRQLLVKDMERDPLPVQPRHSARPARSWLGVPLIAHDQILGMISVQSFRIDAFDLRHCQLLEILAAQVAIGLVNAHYAADLEKSLNEMSALYDLAQKTNSSLDSDEVLKIIVLSLKDFFIARGVSIALLDEKTQTLTMYTTAGIKAKWVQDFRLKVGEGVSGEVVETGESIYVPDTNLVPNFKFFSHDVRCLLVVPLKVRDRIIGTLTIDSDKPNAFSSQEEHLLTIAASQVAVAIENAQLYSKMQELAVTDSLTGVANRRAFDEAIESEVIRATRYGHPLSLIFLDIDDFKIFNDTYGHPAGDDRLIEIAQILTDNVRLPDLVARYGGEEFVVILPHTDKGGACHMAERIRLAAVIKAKAVLSDEEISLQAGSPISGYTLSLGVATIPEDTQTSEDLLELSDWAMLKAKQTGKNRVCSAA